MLLRVFSMKWYWILLNAVSESIEMIMNLLRWTCWQVDLGAACTYFGWNPWMSSWYYFPGEINEMHWVSSGLTPLSTWAACHCPPGYLLQSPKWCPMWRWFAGTTWTMSFTSLPHLSHKGSAALPWLMIGSKKKSMGPAGQWADAPEFLVISPFLPVHWWSFHCCWGICSLQHHSPVLPASPSPRVSRYFSAVSPPMPNTRDCALSASPVLTCPCSIQPSCPPFYSNNYEQNPNLLWACNYD